MGGLVGSAARAAVGLMIPGGDSGFPFEVLVVNLLGSFLLGWYVSRREQTVSGPASTQFWAIGVLGSFTTFSAFSVDVVELLSSEMLGAAILYVGFSLFGGLGLASFGRRLGMVVR
jgi:fluoride exporter